MSQSLRRLGTSGSADTGLVATGVPLGSALPPAGLALPLVLPIRYEPIGRVARRWIGVLLRESLKRLGRRSDELTNGLPPPSRWRRPAQGALSAKGRVNRRAGMPRMVITTMSRSALDAASPQDRLQALLTLVQSGEDLRPFVVELTKLSDDPEAEIAATACDALEMLGPPRAVDLPALIASMQTKPDSEQAYWAATLIGRLGPQAKSAVPALIWAIERSRSLMVRERAAWALGQIGPAAAQARATLEAAASQTAQPPRLKRLILQALESIRGFAA